MSIPAVLLAAGMGTRLRPLTDSTPKCLVPIAGRPLLDFWLEACVDAGFYPIIVNTHHLANQVHEYVCRSSFARHVLLAHEEQLLGTGGTLLRHAEVLQNGPFFVAHADNLSIFALKAFVAAHGMRPDCCAMTMLLFNTTEPESCGIVSLDEIGIVRAFHEKQAGVKGTLANGAVYMMESEILAALRTIPSSHPDLSLDLIPLYLGRIFTFSEVAYHRDIGTSASLARARKDYAAAVGFRRAGERP